MRQLIIDTYLATIGKTWEQITAHERTILSSFADELMKQLSDPLPTNTSEQLILTKRSPEERIDYYFNQLITGVINFPTLKLFWLADLEALRVWR